MWIDNIILCYTGAAYCNSLPCMLLFYVMLRQKKCEALLVGVTIHDTHHYSDTGKQNDELARFV